MGDAALLVLLALVGALLLVKRLRPAVTSRTAWEQGDWRVVDLTHPVTPSMPRWGSDPAVEIQPWSSYDREGYFIQRLAIGEHSGTHWSTPNTLIPGGKSAEQFAAAELVLPAAVIDVRSQACHDPDYRLTRADLQCWEAEHGPIPARSIVILFTGWQSRWFDAAAFFNADAHGIYHFPGFGADAVAFLIAERQIASLGTDTHGADPGNDQDYGASAAIYQAGGMVLECLAGLDQLPPTGAMLVVGGLPIQGGSGSPARVMALVPSVAQN